MLPYLRCVDCHLGVTELEANLARSPVIVHSRKFSKDDIFVHVLLLVVLSLSVFPRLVIFVTMLKFKMDPFLASQQREPS